MWTALAAVILFGSIFAMALVLASRGGSKQAQLENLKAELKKQAEEQARAQRIIDNVTYMSADDARRRLCELQSKQR